MSIPEEVKVAETPVIDQEQNAQDINWKAFREQRAAERKQADDARKEADASKKQAEALKAAMEALLSKNQPIQSNQYENEEPSEKQRIKDLVSQELSEILRLQEKERAEREQAELPLKMKQIHSDFDDVCSQDNIDYMEHHHPEVYRSLKERPDSMQKFADAYKLIKKFIPNYSSKKDENKADKNMVKPQSMNSPGVTQTGDTMVRAGLDQNKKNDNWKRMQLRMKSGG